MTFELICEGLTGCNKGAVEFCDALIAQNRLPTGQVALTEYATAQLRKLKHTPHTMLTPARAKCAECGSERQYGSVERW